MKFESDTEIDKLLRRHARRKATPASSPVARGGDDKGASMSGAVGAHLNADEMNAFAEGALSDATRSRYFAHLADCDECRGLVTNLTLAANVERESSERVKTAAPSASRSWHEVLAALFAPPVLRYALPALALLAVIVVAFVATRERRQTDFVAQNEERQNSSTADSAQTNEQQAQTTTGTSNAPVAPAADASQNANANAAKAGAPPGTETTTSTTQKKEAAAEPDVAAPADASKPAQKPSNDGVLANQSRDNDEAVRVMNAPAPPPVAVAPASKAAEDERRAAGSYAQGRSGAGPEEKNKTSMPLGTTSGVMRDGNAASENTQSGKRAQESSRRESPAARRSRSADTQLSREDAGANAKDSLSSETRNVGGRQFRRQGGAWVDTAYSSSRSTVNVRRGSEQYRALVADEPGIRSIADQLGGTVIIVWKQRAYRIQ